MANPAILEYLDKHLGKYPAEDLRQALLDEGCDPKEVEEALSILTHANSILEREKKNRRRTRRFMVLGAAIGAALGGWIALRRQSAPDKIQSLQGTPNASGSAKQLDFFSLTKNYEYPTRVKALDTRGMLLMGEGRLREALEAFNESLSIMPRNPRALASRGILFQACGRADQASLDHQAALEIEPELKFILSKPVAETYPRLLESASKGCP